MFGGGSQKLWTPPDPPPLSIRLIHIPIKSSQREDSKNIIFYRDLSSKSYASCSLLGSKSKASGVCFDILNSRSLWTMVFMITEYHIPSSYHRSSKVGALSTGT